MELFQPLSAFYARAVDDVRIGATHVSLFVALLRAWNLSGGANPFAIQREAVMKAAKISARHTYNKCLRNLQEYGYIDYVPARNASTRSVVYLKGL